MIPPGRYKLINDMTVDVMIHPTKPDVLLCTNCSTGTKFYRGRMEWDAHTGRRLKPSNDDDLNFQLIPTPRGRIDKTLAIRRPNEDHGT